MSCLVPSCAHAKYNFSHSRSGRSRSLGECLFLVLVVPCSRSFLSLKRSFLVLGFSGNDFEQHGCGTSFYHGPNGPNPGLLKFGLFKNGLTANKINSQFHPNSGQTNLIVSEHRL